MVRSRYVGPARPLAPTKSWFQDGFAATSWSRDQSKPPPIYVRPGTWLGWNYIDNQGYPYDFEEGYGLVDVEAIATDTIYDLQNG